MNFFELNKAFGALLMALIFIMVTGMVTGYIFSEDAPETPGYVIEVADAGDTAAPAEEVEEVDFSVLLADADPAKGEKVAKKCAACHTFEAGGATKTGPNLHGIVDRQIAHVDGFNYSDAMVAFGEGKVWDPETLNAFLKKPKDLIDGTKMAFAGLRKDGDRADLVSYLQTLSE